MSALPVSPSSSPRRAGLPIFTSLLALIAVALLYGGVRLLLAGGSSYYALAGVALAAALPLLWRGRAQGLWLYGLLLASTWAWAIHEVGFDGWALLPRMLVPTLLGLWLVTPWSRRRFDAWQPTGLPSMALPARMLLIGIAASAVGTLLRLIDPPLQEADPIEQTGWTAARPAVPAQGVGQAQDWRHYGGDAGGTRFSTLSQIQPANVANLQEVWRVRLGSDPLSVKGSLQVTPLKVGDTLYACNAVNDVFALDAESGAVRWHVEAKTGQLRTCRGVAYFEVPQAPAGTVCAQRILTATADARLIALDAHTGTRCPGFGHHGEVDLTEGLSQAPVGYYFVTSAPALVRGKVVLGGWVLDGQYVGEPSGVIRAFDAATGQLAWAFDVGRPDRTGLPPSGETYTPGTPNSWGPIAADETLGLVYLPTGNSTPDYFGGHRRDIDDKISSAVVALDADTGRLRWSFQTTHHDLWDYDVASPPTLVDYQTADGGVAHALIQPTKRGELFVLDRATGKPLRQVVEKPAPSRGAVPEERLSPTQPYSDGMPSFRGPRLREEDMWGVTPLDQLFCRIQFKESRYDGPVTPPGLTPSILSPGSLGGHEWGGATIDPDRGLLLINSSRVAQRLQLMTREEAKAKGLRPAGANADLREAAGALPQQGTPYAALILPFLSPLLVPCQAPPYGLLSAVDLASGRLVWHRPFGTPRDSGPFGIPTMLPFEMGMPNIGGAVATRGGVSFIGASQDRYLRAYETSSGRELWKSRLPAGGQATPMTYWSAASSRQFVVIAAGGHGGLMTLGGNYLVAYALPKQ